MKKSHSHKIRFFSPIVFYFILLFTVACQENDLTKIKAMFNRDNVNVEVADSVNFIYKEGAYTRAVVTAKTVKRYTKSQNKLVFPDGLLVKFYDQLTLISILKADYAENDDANQIIKVSGNVYMENSRNEIMETQELLWDMRAKKVNTDKAIKIRTPDNIITGIGFDSNEDFSNYTIRKVSGTVAVDENKGFN